MYFPPQLATLSEKKHVTLFITLVKLPQNISTPLLDKNRKRKQARESEELPICRLAKPLRKRPRIYIVSSVSADIL